MCYTSKGKYDRYIYKLPILSSTMSVRGMIVELKDMMGFSQSKDQARENKTNNRLKVLKRENEWLMDRNEMLTSELTKMHKIKADQRSGDLNEKIFETVSNLLLNKPIENAKPVEQGKRNFTDSEIFDIVTSYPRDRVKQALSMGDSFIKNRFLQQYPDISEESLVRGLAFAKQYVAEEAELKDG